MNTPLDIVTACRSADIPLLKISLPWLQKNLPFRRLHIATAGENLSAFRSLGEQVQVYDEDSLVPNLTLREIREMRLAGFPGGAGWYFQQLLKFSFAGVLKDSAHYLIWDADTIPVRPIQFFDEAGRMLYTKATEYHKPYFQTYASLLGEDAHYEFSFISQHILVRTEWMNEMLDSIDRRLPGNDGWALKIMRNLAGEGTNCFSEYETYGHYLKNHHRDAIAFRELPWSRDGARLASATPSSADLQRLSDQFAFVAFEKSQLLSRRLARWVRGMLRPIR